MKKITIAIMDKIKLGASKLASPPSLSYHDENNKQMTMEDCLQSEELKKLIAPGDIVFT